MSEVAVLECRNLSKSFVDGDRTITVLSEVSFAIQQGQQVAIMGASGSGKSTLLHCLGGLDIPTAGEVSVMGQGLMTLNDAGRGVLRNRMLGFIYQFHHLLPEFSALENVAMPLLIRKLSPRKALYEAELRLKEVGLSERLHHKPGMLSGGERQRAAIARALVTKPACILADEPTGNLDAKTAADVYDVMRQLNREHGTSFIVVTHDAALASKMDIIRKLEKGVLL